MRDLKIILTILDPVVKSNLRRSLPTVGLNIASCNLIGKLELSTPGLAFKSVVITITRVNSARLS